MRTVKEVSLKSGVSVRTLQYYDKIGLLKPTGRTVSGYRLYDDTALEQLRQILLFRELQFSLCDIRSILSSPHFDRYKALEQQIVLLTMKKERLEKLVSLARDLMTKEDEAMDFSAFSTAKEEEYAALAKRRWGDTDAFREYEERTAGRTKEESKTANDALGKIFAEFGALRPLPPSAPEVQAQVKRLQDYITGHFYTCSTEILASLGEMYTADAAFTDYIDKVGGIGTAAFAAEAIRIFCTL